MAPSITDWVKVSDDSGEFRRQTSSFRHQLSPDPTAEFPLEKGRYHLYVSFACPWAHRTLLVRRLRGWEEYISYSAVHWRLGEGGWHFVTEEEAADEEAAVATAAAEGDGGTKDAVQVQVDQEQNQYVIADPIPGHERFSHLSQVYYESEPDYAARFTVPVLYDKKTKRIVNNESSDIVRMLNDISVEKAEEEVVDLFPADLLPDIEAAQKWIYDDINNGVYKTGFATRQDVYERHVHTLFRALDRVERHFASVAAASRGGGGGCWYWFGDRLTAVDIFLYPTLVRFDPVYVQHFKCNLRDIRSGYPYIHAWLRNLYWRYPPLSSSASASSSVVGPFRETTNFAHIRQHYTKSHTQINPLSITPVGPVPHILPPDEEVPAAAAAAATHRPT